MHKSTGTARMVTGTCIVTDTRVSNMRLKMKILVCGGRNYGWTVLADGKQVPNNDERERLTRVLDQAYSEFVRKLRSKGLTENDPPVWSPLDDTSTDGGWDTSLSLRETHSRFTLINGGARGADALAKEWGERKSGVIVDTYYADWKKHGKAAGPIRNVQMLKEGRPNAVVAFSGGSGTSHMISIAEKAGVPVLRVTEKM